MAHEPIMPYDLKKLAPSKIQKELDTQISKMFNLQIHWNQVPLHVHPQQRHGLHEYFSS